MKPIDLSEEDQQVLKKVVQGYAEGILTQIEFFQDPFELYTETLKSKFYVDRDHATSRFMDGYLVLLQELQTISLNEKKKSIRS